MAYVIVEFPEEQNQTAIISNTWICSDQECFFPRTNYNKFVSTATRMDIIQSWPRCKIKVLYNCTSLSAARKKIKALSDVGDTEDEKRTKEQKAAKRKNPVQNMETFNLQGMIKVRVLILLLL
jgi:hypothetical protein